MNDDEYEEEEFLVYADFGSQLTDDDINENNLDVKIIGIDDEHPVIEVSGKIFRGSYNHALGTNVIFEVDSNPPPFDPLYDDKPAEQYRLLTKTNKILEMKRIFLEEKCNDETNQTQLNEQTENQLDECPPDIQSTYADALNMFSMCSKSRPEQNKKSITTQGSSSPEQSDNGNDPDYVCNE